MKLVSWGIVFVIIIFSFSFSLRVILDNKMEIMKKEIEYNNALNEATLDATKELATNIGYEYSTEYEDPRMILNSMNRFFETFGLSFGYYGGNAKNSQIRMYVPAILTMSYNGFYVYHMENVKSRFEHTLTPKQYYATQSGGLSINFTLDDYVRVSENIELEGDPLNGIEGIDSETYTNAYNIEKPFQQIYTPNKVLDPATLTYVDAYSYGDRLIGDIDGNNSVNNNDLTALQSIVWDFWDLEFYSDRSLDIYYTHTHTDFQEYATYWYADINQDGYIEQYDVDILTDYLNNRSSHTWKEANEGRIVDLRHYTDIMSIPANGLYIRTNTTEVTYDGVNYAAGAITYEKSFYTSGGIRYLLEEWYVQNPTNSEQNKYLYRRMTPYTEEDHVFTIGIRNKLIHDGITDTYLYNGNPENTGFINPLTGQYEIGEFNARKKELITQQVTEQLEYYVMKHNQYAGAYGITYDFTLPELSDTDWTNALSDITVIAFVQGIPILGQQYYNNYGLAGSNIIDKEFFIGYNGIYYSSRILDKTNAEFVKRLSNVDVFNYSKEAAEYRNPGDPTTPVYFPDTNRDPTVLEGLIESNVMITYEDIGSTTTEYKWRIKGGTFIDEILYIHDNTGVYNRNSFYNNSDAVQKVDPIHINQYYDGTEYVTEVTIPRNIYGRTLVLIRDVDGRVKYETNGSLISTPTINVISYSGGYFTVEVDNLRYSLIEEGGTITYTYGGNSRTRVVTEADRVFGTTKYRCTLEKLPSSSGSSPGTHYFTITRVGDGAHDNAQWTIPSLPGPQITYLNYNASTNAFEISMKNLMDEDGNVDVTLEYTYTNPSGGTSKVTYTESDLGYSDVITGKPIPQQGYWGTHTFKITRIKDGKSDTDFRVINQVLSVINATYTQSTNTVGVSVSGLAGYAGTVNWIATGGDGSTLESGTATIPAGGDYCEFNPPASCIPGNFTFTVTDGSRTSSAYSATTFYPIIEITVFTPAWSTDRKIRIASTTVIDNPTTIRYIKYKEDGTSYENKTTSWIMSSNKFSTNENIDFVASKDDRGHIQATITVNGFNLIYNRRYVYVWGNFDDSTVTFTSPNGPYTP